MGKCYSTLDFKFNRQLVDNWKYSNLFFDCIIRFINFIRVFKDIDFIRKNLIIDFIEFIGSIKVMDCIEIMGCIEFMDCNHFNIVYYYKEVILIVPGILHRCVIFEFLF